MFRICLQFSDYVLGKNRLTSFATEFDCRLCGPFFHFMLYGSAPGFARSRMTFCTQGTGWAIEELMPVEGEIDAIVSDPRFGATIKNGHRIIACGAGKIRRFRIPPVLATAHTWK